MSTSAHKRISVLLVDDHAVVREGYRRLLEREDSLVVAGEAATAADAMRLDADLLDWFRRHPGYQTRINAVLRAYMSAQAGHR